jgi:phage gp46-like protein
MSDIKTAFTDLSTGTQYDIGNLGLAEDDSLTTAVIISLFTDKRDTTAQPQDARGWWAGDIGSLRWTLSRSKQNNEILQKLIKFDTAALQWLIDDMLVKSIDITAQWVTRGVLTEQITITLNNDKQLVFAVEEPF